MYPIQSRADRSRLHTSMLDALPNTPQAEAFCEAVAWADTGGIADLATLFSLADAIDHHANQAVYHSDCQFAEIDADELRAELGAPTVNLALKLAGFSARQRGRQMIWTDVPKECRARMVPISLPPDLLEQ